MKRIVGAFLLLTMFACGGTAAVGEPCENSEDDSSNACEGDATCIASQDNPGESECAPPCEAGVAGCTRESCDDFCVPASCTAHEECPLGTTCLDDRCRVVFD